MKARTWVRIGYIFCGLNLGFVAANIQYNDIGYQTAASFVLGVIMFFVGMWQEEQARLER